MAISVRAVCTAGLIGAALAALMIEGRVSADEVHPSAVSGVGTTLTLSQGCGQVDFNSIGDFTVAPGGTSSFTGAFATADHIKIAFVGGGDDPDPTTGSYSTSGSLAAGGSGSWSGLPPDQDFYANFALGHTGTFSLTVDADGEAVTSVAFCTPFQSIVHPMIASIMPDAGPGADIVSARQSTDNTNVSPSAGGTSVNITGTNLAGATSVMFGSTPAASFTINCNNSISATAPAGSGTVDVTVTTSAGTSTTGAADRFTYNATSGTAPTVTGLAGGRSGPAEGGTSILLGGSGFTGTTAVEFCGIPATSFFVLNDTTMFATSPAGGGVVDVMVTNAAGTSTTSTRDRFTYIPAHDFDQSGLSDILFRNSTGTVALWLMNGGVVYSSGTVASPPNSYSIIGQRDFDGDQFADLLWRDTGGNLYMWFMNGTAMSSSASLGNVPLTWTVMGTGDMNGDGNGDLLWQDAAGDLAIWFMNGSTISSSESLGTVAPSSNWSIVWATNSDILWRNTAASPYTYALWQVNGSTVKTATLGGVPSNWIVQGLGDFNGDGIPDILWRDNTSGTVAIWFLSSSGQLQSSGTVGAVSTGTTWKIAEVGDYNGDGVSDILWIDGSGNLAIWLMNGATTVLTATLGNIGTTWQVQAANAE